MSEPTWHGLNHEQWMALFDVGRWREAVACTLYTVARSPDASPGDRLFALQLINDAIAEGKLAKDPYFPVLLRDVHVELVMGWTPTRWWGRKRRRKALHVRLAAARWLLGTVDHFPAKASPKPEFAVEQREVDMSRCS